MSKTIIVIPDSHAHPDFPNDRADWIGGLIADVKPDILVHIGDSADMASLSTYDKGKRSFQGRNYRKDVDAHIEFQERMWAPIKKLKRRLPETYFFIGNHEHRIARALDLSPELEGAISMSHLELDRWYDTVVHYSGGTPGILNIEGITFAHYFVGGIAGRPLGGIHAAYTLVTKKHSSATCGHSHLFDMHFAKDLDGKPIIGCFVGCAQDYDNDWAGEIAGLWDRGVLIKKNVTGDGGYDPTWVSLDALKKEYGNAT